MAYEFTQNRELSWLKFNERVLEEAANASLPLLERLKFFAIFCSNLDEFFMIRVGSLKDLEGLKNQIRDSKTGLTPKEQLTKIYANVQKLYHKKDEIYKCLVIEMASNNILFDNLKDINQEKKIKKVFKQEILPFLSPQVIDVNHPFPHLENKRSYIVVLLEDNGDKITLGIVGIPDTIPNYLCFSGRYFLTERLIYEFSDQVFKGHKVKYRNIIRVTRNADLNFLDAEIELQTDYRKVMRQLIKKRSRLNPVRVECLKNLNPIIKEFLKEKIKVTDEEFFISKSPFSFNFIYSLTNNPEYKNFFFPKLEQKNNSLLDLNRSIISQIKKKDALLFYPFESMEPFLRLIREAANDKNVMSIQITIYRLSQKSRLVDYLCQAAENGKEVTVLIELRARFDEDNNINYSEKLEDAGCKVMYGFDEYKVHSKICLITFKNNNKINYITQIGTGNYNEKTVNLYTDYSLITANEKIGIDAHNFFKNMLLGNLEGDYGTILVAPHSLRPQILNLIEREIKKGKEGYIFFKLNSITDITIINKLSEASRAGVKIDLIVRGICTILPAIPNYTENIFVMSIVGRFLEHSRIYLFGKDNDTEIFISSADMMTRNTIKRVEIAVPILDNEIKEEIKEHISIMLYDNVNGRRLTSTGEYMPIEKDKLVVNSQAYFLQPLEIEKKGKRIASIKLTLSHLLAENNILFSKNQSLSFEPLNQEFKFDFVVEKNYLILADFSNTEDGMKRFYEKYHLINSLLLSEDKKLIIVLKSPIKEEYQRSLNRLGIESYLKDNLDGLIKRLKDI